MTARRKWRFLLSPSLLYARCIYPHVPCETSNRPRCFVMFYLCTVASISENGIRNILNKLYKLSRHTGCHTVYVPDDKRGDDDEEKHAADGALPPPPLSPPELCHDFETIGAKKTSPSLSLISSFHFFFFFILLPFTVSPG